MTHLRGNKPSGAVIPAKSGDPSFRRTALRRRVPAFAGMRGLAARLSRRTGPRSKRSRLRSPVSRTRSTATQPGKDRPENGPKISQTKREISFAKFFVSFFPSQPFEIIDLRNRRFRGFLSFQRVADDFISRLFLPASTPSDLRRESGADREGGFPLSRAARRRRRRQGYVGSNFQTAKISTSPFSGYHNFTSSTR